MPAVQWHVLIMLLITDSPEDEALFRRAIEGAAARFALVSVHSVAEAISLLRNLSSPAPGQACPITDIIVVDVSDPQCDPSELLLWVQNNRTFRVLPVIILSRGASDERVTRAYSLGANAVIDKPIVREDLFRLYTGLADFWSFSLVPPIAKAA